MKKLLVLTLAMLLVFCGCGKKAENTEAPSNSNDTVQESTPEAPVVDEPIVTDDVELGEYAGKFIAKYVESGTFYIKERTEANGEMQETELAISGNKASLRTADTNQIVDGDTLYLVMHDQKAVLTSPVAEVMKDNMMQSLGIKTAQDAEDNFLSTGTEEVNGTQCSYEEYQNGTEKIKYYFDTETVRYIKHTAEDGGETLYEILQISKEVPKDMFDIPDGYVIQDLSSIQ